MTDTELIDYYGGPSALARRIGFTHPKLANRVVNWRTRGIPSKVKLENQKLFGPAAVRKAEAAVAKLKAEIDAMKAAKDTK